MIPFLKYFLRDLTFRGHSGFGSFLAWIVLLALLWAIAGQVWSTDLQGQIAAWRIPVVRVGSDKELTGLMGSGSVTFKTKDDKWAEPLNSFIIGNSSTTPTFSFVSNGKPALVFHPDGTITSDPSLKPDEAAQRVLDTLRVLYKQSSLRLGPCQEPAK